MGVGPGRLTGGDVQAGTPMTLASSKLGLATGGIGNLGKLWQRDCEREESGRRNRGRRERGQGRSCGRVKGDGKGGQKR